MHVVLLIENEGKSPFLFLYDTTPLFLFCFNSNVSPKKLRRKNQRLCRLQRKCKEEGKRKALSSKTHIKKKGKKSCRPQKKKSPKKKLWKIHSFETPFLEGKCMQKRECKMGDKEWTFAVKKSKNSQKKVLRNG